jgi:hypothetical protein
MTSRSESDFDGSRISGHPQWEYRKLDLNDVPTKLQDTDLLTAAGRDGWELVTITGNNIAYLKRPREAAPKSGRATTSSR